MEDIIDYETIEREYKRACEGGGIPNLIVMRSIRRTKAVRRVVGRLLRRGKVTKGEVLWPCKMKNDFGALVV